MTHMHESCHTSTSHVMYSTISRCNFNDRVKSYQWMMSYDESGHVTNESCHISINDSYHISSSHVAWRAISGHNLQIRHLMYACMCIYKRGYKYAYESNKQICIHISWNYIHITIYIHMTLYIYILVYTYIRQLYTYTQYVYTCRTYITYIHICTSDCTRNVCYTRYVYYSQLQIGWHRILILLLKISI